jgi:hypothetical protein
MKFVLLHEGKNDDGIKAFFTDVWELYVKVRLHRRWSNDEYHIFADNAQPLPHRAYSDTQSSI